LQDAASIRRRIGAHGVQRLGLRQGRDVIFGAAGVDQSGHGATVSTIERQGMKMDELHTNFLSCLCGLKRWRIGVNISIVRSSSWKAVQFKAIAVL
jgi:hypothetical protein